MSLPSRAGYDRKHPLFTVWWSMHLRCSYPRVNKYSYYGGRGISVCARWSLFTTFLDDMGPRPSRKHELDRINPEGPYSPTNCRWILGATNRRRAG